MQTIDLIKSDLIAISAKTDIFHLLLYFLFSYNKRPLFLIRIANSNWRIAKMCRRYLKSKYLIELGCKNIGPYLRLPHPKGIILSATEIGSNCLIAKWVTLGGNNCEYTLMSHGGGKIFIPTIGDNVQIYAGSVVAGPITIENDVIIGANSTVTFNVASNSMIYNRPSISRKKIKVLGYKGPFEKYE